jgi:hypothetical protein
MSYAGRERRRGTLAPQFERVSCGLTRKGAFAYLGLRIFFSNREADAAYQVGVAPIGADWVEPNGDLEIGHVGEARGISLSSQPRKAGVRDLRLQRFGSRKELTAAWTSHRLPLNVNAG